MSPLIWYKRIDRSLFRVHSGRLFFLLLCLLAVCELCYPIKPQHLNMEGSLPVVILCCLVLHDQRFACKKTFCL
uniref:Uncharacterized protein n=1 Tax=Panagrolaimus sp. PS1159 TaxID=55785 RepID=A0AC35GEX6_9BILA